MRRKSRRESDCKWELELEKVCFENVFDERVVLEVTGNLIAAECKHNPPPN